MPLTLFAALGVFFYYVFKTSLVAAWILSLVALIMGLVWQNELLMLCGIYALAIVIMRNFFGLWWPVGTAVLALGGMVWESKRCC